MNIKIFPSKINGTIAAPPSKSVTHRAIIVAALANGKSTITNVLFSEDTKYTIEALRTLGVKIKQNGNTLIIEGSGENLTAPKKPINVGNSGSTMRMLASVALLARGKTILTGKKRLQERPMEDLLNTLNTIGIHARSTSNNNCPPIEIDGGKLRGGAIHIRGDVSSQYISALLLIAPFAKKSTTIIVDGQLKSKPYILVTIDVMKRFGINVKNDNFQIFIVEKGQSYKSQKYYIEGDFSSASYFFASAAITKGKVSVEGLNPNSVQGDKYFLKLLKRMGCNISINTNEITVSRTGNLKSINANMEDYPDIVQTLSVVATFAKGTTKISNIGHLRFKESDRIATTVTELKKMGISCYSDTDSMSIVGGKPKGAIIDTHNDHRVAMSFAIAALGAKGATTIKNAEVVNKSYPNFFEDLKKLGANVIS